MSGPAYIKRLAPKGRHVSRRERQQSADTAYAIGAAIGKDADVLARAQHVTTLRECLASSLLPEAMRIHFASWLAHLLRGGNLGPRRIRTLVRYASWIVRATRGKCDPPSPSSPERIAQAKRIVAINETRGPRSTWAPFLNDPSLLPKRPPARRPDGDEDT
jgi:hypothetical protein